MKDIEKISLLLGVVLSLGGIAYSAGYLKKDVEVVSNKTSILESKVDNLSESLTKSKIESIESNTEKLPLIENNTFIQSLKIDLEKLKTDVDHNEKRLSEYNDRIIQINNNMLYSSHEIKMLLIRYIDNVDRSNRTDLFDTRLE